MTSNAMIRWLSAGALCAGMLGISPGSSAVPSRLTQQGRLFDRESSEPFTGSIPLVFTIYDQPEEGTVLWTEAQTVTLDDGYFSAQLGDVEPLDPDIFDGSVRYLGVRVGSDSELVPRQEISSVPYALHAAHANSIPFTGISDIPSPCGAGQFLKGYTSAGVPTCDAPALSCRRTASANISFGSGSDSVTTPPCSSDEILTGGGCRATNANVTESFPDDTQPNNGQAWSCEAERTTGTAFLTATGICCRTQ